MPTFVLVHTPLETAVARATRRSEATGRACPREFIESRLDGLRRFSREASRICVDAGGTAMLLDNSPELHLHGAGLQRPTAGFSGSSEHAALAADYDLPPELLRRGFD